MPDVMGAGHFLWEDDALRRIGTGIGKTGFAEKCVVAFGDCSAPVVPARDVLELDFENCSLKAIEACVPSHLIVMVAAAHSMLAQHSRALGNFVIVGGDHAGVAGGAEVLGGIEA